jgi:DNA-binding NtrC family response regulator
VKASRILVVEDDSELGQLLEDFLSRLGYEVKFVDSPTSAIKYFSEGSQTLRPDLVICDIKMSPTDGLELTEKMLVLQPRLPVILFSAYGGKELETEALRVGAKRFLEKPFGLTAIANAVSEELARVKSNCEVKK